MRRAAILLLVSAATARAGGGVYVLETAAGVVGGAAGVAAAHFALGGVGEGRGVESAAAGVALVGGSATAVWLVGEGLDGRSENRSASYLGALGGSALGGVLGSAILIPVALAVDDGDDDAVGAFILGAFVVAFVGPPIMSTVVYNAVKEPEAPDVGGLTVAPTIAALPPRAPGEPPTLTYGLSASF
jgi:hypothetical protein